MVHPDVSTRSIVSMNAKSVVVNVNIVNNLQMDKSLMLMII